MGKIVVDTLFIAVCIAIAMVVLGLIMEPAPDMDYFYSLLRLAATAGVVAGILNLIKEALVSR